MKQNDKRNSQWKGMYHTGKSKVPHGGSAQGWEGKDLTFLKQI